jgi:nitrogen regulatory protein PII
MSTKSVPVKTAVLLTVIAETVLQDRITKLLQNLGATGFTITPAQGFGRHGFRMGDIAGYNTNIEIKTIVSPDICDKIFSALSELQEKYALIAFQQNVEVLL